MNRRSRRQFLQGSPGLAGLSLLAGCGVLPPAAPPAVRLRRIGYLRFDSPTTQPGSAHEAFMQGLRELGYVEGVDHRRAAIRGQQARATAGARGRTDRARGGAHRHYRTQAARQVTSTLPLVSPTLRDPVATGLVASLARPGGNVTGLSLLWPQLSGKRLELLSETVPGASRMAVLWRPANEPSGLQFQETQEAARKLGMQVQSLEVHDLAKLGGLVEAASAARADALIIFADPLIFAHEPLIVDLAARSRLPSLHGRRESVVAGGLMAYGPNYPAQFRRAATYVDKILKGDRPADLPIEQPTQFDFPINLKTAQALGLTVPQSLLLQATEVIQ